MKLSPSPRYGVPSVIFWLSLIWLASSWAQEVPVPKPESSSGFVIPESIKGFDEQKVKDDPVCDSSVRPYIKKVEPDEMASGDTIMVQGSDFGKKKECLHSVSFGSEQAKTFTYVDDEHIQATVPEGVRTGVTFLNITTGGGTARKGILIKPTR